MAAVSYFIRDHQGNVSGPYTGAKLRQLASSRKLDLSWHISTDQMKWCVAAKVKNLSASLEGVLTKDLSTGDRYRNLTRQEVVAIFLDKFVLNNENFNDSWSFFQAVRKWWVKLMVHKQQRDTV